MSALSRSAFGLALENAPDWLLGMGVQWQGRKLAQRRFAAPFKEELERAVSHALLPRDVIELQQLEELRRVLSLAQSGSEYYRSALREAQVSPSEITSFDTFTAVPLLDRQTVASEMASMLVRAPTSHDVLHHTSGSTGRRLDFWQPQRLRYQINAAHLYALYSWFGFEPGMKRVTLGGRYLGTRRRGRVLYNRAENQLALSSHSMSSANIERYVEAMSAFSPVAVQGHPSVIGQLVSLAHEASLELPHVRLIFTTGEELTAELRTVMTEGFSAEHVVDMYGGGENVLMASQCPIGHGLHVDESYGYVELVPHPSGMQEIVATSLFNDVMPMVRYRTGDLTKGWIEEPCSCGRSWRRLDGLVGRIDDTVRSAAGVTVLPMTIRTTMASRVSPTPAYKVRVNEDRATAELVLYDDGMTPAAIELGMKAVIEELLEGDTVTVRHESVGGELSAGGKRRIVERARSTEGGSQ